MILAQEKNSGCFLWQPVALAVAAVTFISFQVVWFRFCSVDRWFAWCALTLLTMMFVLAAAINATVRREGQETAAFTSSRLSWGGYAKEEKRVFGVRDVTVKSDVCGESSSWEVLIVGDSNTEMCVSYCLFKIDAVFQAKRLVRFFALDSAQRRIS